MASDRSLGTLTLNLIAQVGGFTAALDKASRDTDKSLSDLEKRAYEFGETFGEYIKSALVGIGIALSVDAFVDSIKEALERLDSLGKSAAKVNLPVDQFSQLAGAARLSEVSVDDLTTTLGRLTKAQAAALDANSQQAKIFNALGISVKNADGSLRSSEDVLEDFADKFQQLNGSPEAIAAGIQLFGKSFQNIIPFIQNGSSDIKNLKGEVDELGGTIDAGAAQSAQDFNDSITKLSIATEGLYNRLAAKLLPTLNSWIDTVVSLAKNNSALDDIVTGVSDGLEALAIAGHAVDAIFALILADIQSITTVAQEAINQAQAVGKAVVHTLTLGQAGPQYSQIWQQFSVAGQTAASSVQESWEAARKKVIADYQASLKNIDNIQNGQNRPSFSNVSGGHSTSSDNGLAQRLRAALTVPDKDAEKRANDLAEALQKLYDQVQKIGEASDPAQKAYSTYAQTIRQVDQLAADAIKKGANVKDVQDEVSQAVDAAQIKLAQDLAKPMEAAKAFADQLDNQLQAQKDLTAAQVAAVGIGSEEAKNQQQLAQVYKQGQDALAQLQKQYETHPESFTQEQYDAEVKALKQHNADMLQVTVDGQNAISAAQSDWRNGVNKALQDFIDQQNNLADIAGKLTSNFLDDASNSLSEFIDGTKSAKDALSDFLNSFEQQITQAVSKQLLKQLFDIGGTGGSSGGLFSGIFDFLTGGGFGGKGSFFGPARANGGPVSSGTIYRVNERGPELLTVGGRDYLMTGAQSGYVTPNNRIGGGSSQTNNFYLAAPTSKATQDQIAVKTAYQLNRVKRLSS